MRDRVVGRIALFALVLAAALLASRSCASHDREVSQEEAVEIATGEVDFTPCTETGCVVVRAVQRGIPPRLVWIVGLAEALDEDGDPTRFANFVVDATTGDVTQE